MEKHSHRSVRWILTAVFLIGVAFFFGYVFRWESKADRATYYELENFSKILQYVQSNYVEEVKSETLIKGAIRGLLDELDPHSAYLTPDLYRDMKEETSGQFGGVGIEVAIKSGYILVVAPIEGTPAYRAGVKPMDRIIEIDGTSTRKMDLGEAINHMRGELGSEVKLKIFRPSENKKMDFAFKRERIALRSVRHLEIDDNIVYIRISSFIEKTAFDAGKALEEVRGGRNLKGVILDLRGNPGGLLDQAVKVTNLFVDEGPVVYTIGRDSNQKEIEYAQKGFRRTAAPMVVLVDASSASSSEIVAGALQDHGRAVIAGKQTFGKGSVQNIIPVGNGAGLKLTIARYYTPSGRSIQATGITPDVELEDIDYKFVEESRKKSKSRIKEADLKGHFENENAETDVFLAKDKVGEPNEESETWDVKTRKDFMVAQALGILKTMSIVKEGMKKPVFEIERQAKNTTADQKNEEDVDLLLDSDEAAE